MKELKLTATATLKSFTNEQGEELEYCDIRTDINGISVKLILPDKTAKELLKQVLKGGN